MKSIKDKVLEIKEEFEERIFWQKMWILIKRIILVLIIIELGLFLPVPTKADNNSWLQFYGSIIGSMLGGIVALIGIKVTFKSIFMNVKPLIRPIKTTFCVYRNVEWSGILITDEKLNVILEKYFEKEEINFYDLDIWMLETICIKVSEKYRNTKWQFQLSVEDVENMYECIKDICKYRSAKEGFHHLFFDFSKKYDDKFNKVILEEILYELRQKYIDKCLEHIIEKQEREWRKFLPIYNFGAGNGLDVKVDWDMKDGAYKKYCEKLGISSESFEFKDSSDVPPLDIIRNESGKNKTYFEIPMSIVDFIEEILKQTDETINKNQEGIDTNILLHENKIAQIKVTYEDIYGTSLGQKYDVYFRCLTQLTEFKECKVRYFYLTFKNTKI